MICSRAITAPRSVAALCRNIAAARNASSGRMAGKTVVVCGAGNNEGEEFGIGKCTAILMAREGANVVSVSNLAAHAEGTTDFIKGEGNSGLAAIVDCTSDTEVKRLLDETVSEYGSVDCLINAVRGLIYFNKMLKSGWGGGGGIITSFVECIKNETQL